DPRASEILEAARSMQHTLMGSAEIPQLYWKEAIYQDVVLMEECPYALSLLRFLRWCQKLVLERSPEMTGSTELFAVLFENPFSLTPGEALPSLVNSRFFEEFWPLIGLVSSRHAEALSKLDPQQTLRQSLRCDPGEVDWPNYLAKLQEEPRGSLIWFDLPGVSDYEEQFGENPGKMLDCPMGAMTSTLEKLLIMQEFYTEGYGLVAEEVALLLDQLEQLAERVGRSSLDFFFLSEWPFWDKLAHLHERATKRRLRYDLEFHPWELLGEVPDRPGRRRPSIAALRWQLPSSSPLQRQILLALEELWDHRDRDGAPAPPVLCTLLWGQRLAKYLRFQVQRLEAFGYGHQYLVLCDAVACNECRRVHWKSLCVEMRQPSLFSKHTMITSILRQGFDVFYLDFDTVLLQDPLPSLKSRMDLAETQLLVSRDFGTECLNTGVIFAKSHPLTVAFWERLLLWLWHHPFEFTQKAFAALLGVERVALHGSLAEPQLPQLPHWGLLDPQNAFVTSKVYSSNGVHFEGWTGDLEEIVVFHFLDGSGSVEQNNSIRGYKDLFEVFLSNPKVNLSDTRIPLYDQDPVVRSELLWSRHDAAPQELLKCRLVNM
ncbi:unnamed protein product, partial [Cladocopium goreaui]